MLLSQKNNYEIDVTVVWLFFRGKSRSKSRQLGTEPIVRFSFNNGDDEDELYKGLENPSYAVRERPHKRISRAYGSRTEPRRRSS